MVHLILILKIANFNFVLNQGYGNDSGNNYKFMKIGHDREMKITCH